MSFPLIRVMGAKEHKWLVWERFIPGARAHRRGLAPAVRKQVGVPGTSASIFRVFSRSE